MDPVHNRSQVSEEAQGPVGAQHYERCRQTFKELSPKELKSRLKSNLMELAPDLGTFQKVGFDLDFNSYCLF